MGPDTSVEATGDYEVTIKLPAANGAWRNLLAFPNGGPVIYPEEVASKAGAEPIADVSDGRRFLAAGHGIA